MKIQIEEYDLVADNVVHQEKTFFSFDIPWTKKVKHDNGLDVEINMSLETLANNVCTVRQCSQ